METKKWFYFEKMRKSDHNGNSGLWVYVGKVFELPSIVKAHFHKEKMFYFVANETERQAVLRFL